MIEKLENCPDCNKALDQAEYDGQYCRACGTEPFGFQKAKRRKVEPVSRARLEFLAATVEYELARIAARVGKQPAYSSDGYYLAREAWWEKWKSEVEESRRRLAAEGARFAESPPDGYAIRLAGIRSSSTSGFAGAFRNWLTAARKRLAKEAA